MVAGDCLEESDDEGDDEGDDDDDDDKVVVINYMIHTV